MTRRIEFRDLQPGEPIDVSALLAKAGTMAPSVRAVLRTLLARAKAGVREIPTTSELSARGGGTESTCSRALRQLIANGVLELRDIDHRDRLRPAITLSQHPAAAIVASSDSKRI